MYQTPKTKLTPVYKPKGMQIGMESGALEPIAKPIKTRKKPAGVSDKAWAILNVENTPETKGITDMPRIGKNKV